MSDVNPGNERLKRRYFHHMAEAKGLAEATIGHAARAVAAYERYTNWKPFSNFTSKDAIAFKKSLLADGGKRSAELSSRATIYTKLNHLMSFFKWLAEQPGLKTKVSLGDADYFHLSRRDGRLAQERPDKPAPTLEQIQTAIRHMPADTDVELRDRAVMAFLILTGARVRAVTTFKLKHVLPNRLGVRQDARDVATKGSKTFTTFFFPVGDDLRGNFLDYVEHLRVNLARGSDDPLFPSTRQDVAAGKNSFEIVGLANDHWSTAEPVRSICRRAFERAGIVYFSPHSFRRTLALLAEERCRTPAELKAWSQNLGHDQLLTTLTSYGALPEARQAELVAGLTGEATNTMIPNHLLEEIVEQVTNRVRESVPTGKENK